ncbi:ABC transporter ATP-binding protein [Microbacterium natoriense]
MRGLVPWRVEREPRVLTGSVPDPRGTWKRFVVLLWRARLPIVLIIVLFIVSKFSIDVGLDQMQYTGAIIAGDVSVATVALLMAAMLVGWALDSVSGLLAGIIEQLINRNLRRLVWRHVVRLPLAFFRDAPPREMVSRITTDPDSMGRFVMRTLYPLILSLYTIYAVAVRVFEFDARLTLMIVGFVPVLMFLGWAVGRLQYFAQRDVTVRNAGLTQRLAEYVAHIPLIKAFAVTAREQQHGDAMIGDLYRANVRTGIVSAVSYSLFSTVGLMQTAGLIAVGVFLIGRGELSVPEWVAFFLYAGTVANNISSLTGAWEQAKSVQGTTARVAEIVYARGESGGTTPMPRGDGDIEFDALTFGFDGQPVLQDVTVTFPQSKLTVVVGPSGSGKSTLLRLLQRMHTPSSGRIRLHGRPVSEYELAGYRSAFASAGQDAPIVDGTVRENLLLGDDQVRTDQELEAALRLHADDAFLANLPEGLDSQTGDYGSKLSGGQRHRLCLARVLLRDAPFILLDEPTAALDADAERDALDEIRAATQGRTSILVAHTPAALAIADHVIVVENGRITASGAPESVASDSEFLREAFMKRDER